MVECKDKKYIIGIDLGGMSAKGALFSFDGKIIQEGEVPTKAENGFEGTLKSLSKLAKQLAEKAQINFEEVKAIGVGAPGVVDSQNGIILRWSNFAWDNVPFAERLSKLTGKK